MDNILQPLRQFVLHIRSKDADREGLLNSHLFVDLAEPINIDARTEEIHQIILSAELPYSFYNISGDIKNNEIKYSVSGVDYTFTLPTQDYDITELVRVITDDATFPFSAVYNKFTMKITLTNTSVDTVTLKWTQSNSFKVLGFSNASDVDIVAGGTAISDNIIDLATIHSLMIKSNTASNMVFSTRAGFSQTIQKVSVDVNSGDIIYLNQNDSRQHTVLNSNVDMLDLRITDQNDNLINFNNINYEITVGFFIYPLNKKNVPRQIEGRGRRVLQPPPTTALVPQVPQTTLRQYTPQNIVREDINTINNDIDNHETDIEHKGKRLIIDEVIKRISENNK